MHRSVLLALSSALATALAAPAQAANVDGTLDSGYGTAGYTAFGFLESERVTLRAVAASPFDRTWLFGDDPIDVRAVYLAKVDGAGVPDPAFSGDGQTRSVMPAGLGPGEPAVSIDGALVQSNGQPLFFGGLYPQAAVPGAYPGVLCQLAVAGNFDADFGTSGCRTFRTFLSNDEICRVTDVEQGADGAYLAVGNCAGTTLPNRPFLARVTAAGAFDLEFGGGAGLLTPVLPAVSPQGQYFEALSLKADGTIVVLAQVELADAALGRNRDLAVVQFDGGGSLIPTFGGGDGIATLRYDLGADQTDRPVDIDVRADGRIVVLGQATALNPVRAVATYAQLTAAGVPDATFDGDGLATDDFGGALDAASSFRDIEVDADGKIVVGAKVGERGVSPPSAGTDFWIAPVRAVPPDTDAQVLITSDVRTSGIAQAAAGYLQRFDVVPGRATRLLVPLGDQITEGSESITGKGIHLRTQAPVSVHFVTGRMSAYDGTLSHPTNALGTTYRVASWPNGLGEGMYLTAVATENGTSLTITPKVAVGIHPAGQPYVINLDRGQTYRLSTPQAQDITGTLVQSNRPIAFYSGHSCAQVPNEAVDFCELMMEQQTPVERWGTQFVVAPFAGRTVGDLVRVLAHENDTAVSINGTQVAMLAAGAVYETSFLTGLSIAASKPVAVHQLAKSCKLEPNPTCPGDPTMLSITPTDRWLHRYAATVPTLAQDNNRYFVDIVAQNPQSANVIFDDALVQPAAFSPIGTTGFWSAAIETTPGRHTVVSRNPVGVYVHGVANSQAFAHPAASAPGGDGLDNDDLVVRYRRTFGRDPVFGTDGVVRIDHRQAFDTPLRSDDTLQNLVVTKDAIYVGSISVNAASNQSLFLTYKLSASELFRDGFE